MPLRRDGEDFVVAFQPEDTIVFRNGDPVALHMICGLLRWKIISDTADRLRPQNLDAPERPL